MTARFGYKDVLRLAWPNTIAMFSETLMGLVDTKLVGGLGGTALAAVGLGASFFYLVFVTLLGFTRGIKICTAHAVGEGRPEVGVQFAILGAGLGLGIGTLAALTLQHAYGFMLFVGIGPEVAREAANFLAARSWGLPAACAVTALMEHRQGLGIARRPALIGVLGNFVNAPLAYALIYGHLGFAPLGVVGAGYGSAVAECVQLSIGAAWLLHTWLGQRRLHTPMPAWHTSVGELTRLGVPTALHFGFECLAYVSFTAVLGGLQPREIGAHQVAIAINRAAFLPGLAISEAVSVLVGQALGANLLHGADRAVGAGLRLAMGFMVACGIFFFLCRNMLLSAFTNDPDIIVLGAQLLLIAAVFQFLDAINLTMRGALRGAKDVKVTAIVGIAILWTCVPTSAYFLGKVWGMGVVGGWCGFIAEAALAATFLSWRWRRGAWRRAYEPVPVTV